MRMISTTILLIMSFNLFAQYNAEAAACQAKGNNWIEGQGCKVPQAIVDLRNQAKSCTGLQGAELNTCTQQAAENSTSSKHKKSFSKNEGLLYTNALAQVLGVAIGFTTSTNSCSQASYWLMFGGAIATLAGEILARTKYKKTMKEASEKYGEMETEANASNEESVTNKQLAAFDKLIDIEKAREKAEKTRKTLYTASLVLYAAAAVAAALEVWVPALKALESTCVVTANYSQPSEMIDISKLAYYDESYNEYRFLGLVSVQEFIEISIRKVSNLVIPSANASTGMGINIIQPFVNPSTMTIVAEKVVEAKTVSMRGAVMRIATAALMGTSSALLMSKAGKNVEVSKKRQKELADMRKKFAETAGIISGRCTTEMRSDSGNPNCFCYLEDGTKDASKRNLVICVENWGNSNVSNAGNYNASTNTSSNSGIQTCVTKSYQSDLGCKCKGNKSCLTVAAGQLSFGGAMAWAAPIMKDVNSRFGNGLESGAFSETKYLNQAATLNKKLDEMEKDKRFKSVLAKAKKIEKQIEARDLKRIQKLFDEGKLGDLLGGSDTLASKEQDKKTEAKLVASLPKQFSSALKAKKLESFDLDFGEGNDSGVEVVGEDANANADYKYDAVLHKNPDANIFKILSNRYMKTGVKNLFEDKLEEKKQ